MNQDLCAVPVLRIRRGQQLLMRAGSVAAMSGHVQSRPCVPGEVLDLDGTAFDLLALPHDAPVAQTDVHLTTDCVLAVPVVPSASWRVHEACVLGMTPGVRLTPVATREQDGGTSYGADDEGEEPDRGRFTRRPVPLLHVQIQPKTNATNAKNYLYITASFGRHRRHVLDSERDSLVIAAPMFLAMRHAAADNTSNAIIRYEPVGQSLFSALANRAVLLQMRVRGPAVVYTQPCCHELLAQKIDGQIQALFCSGRYSGSRSGDSPESFAAGGDSPEYTPTTRSGSGLEEEEEEGEWVTDSGEEEEEEK